jgi:hypothetical protein
MGVSSNIRELISKRRKDYTLEAPFYLSPEILDRKSVV